MELGEIIGAPDMHSTTNEKCPFCPPEKPPTFTTHPGAENDSKVLARVMDNPSALVGEQSGARPKDGAAEHQEASEQQPYPAPPFTAVPHGAYSYEAHHLISGKQALKPSSFERWIVAGDTIEKDTGYSVNNADNGIWAPSIPEEYKGGNWGPMTFDQKFAIARLPMEAGLPQFHKGHHAISDPDDPDGYRHKTYDAYLKKMLASIGLRMNAWANRCALCDGGEKKPFQPSVRVNQVLDNLSRVMRRKISAPAANWEVFISRYALEFHKLVCMHNSCSRS